FIGHAKETTQPEDLIFRHRMVRPFRKEHYVHKEPPLIAVRAAAPAVTSSCRKMPDANCVRPHDISAPICFLAKHFPNGEHWFERLENFFQFVANHQR
ncbi:MAG: hypothetical protein ACREQ4_06620, partial [Candidatus Binataceae bacterium]